MAQVADELILAYRIHLTDPPVKRPAPQLLTMKILILG